MKLKALVFLLLISAGSAVAQQWPSDLWHDGKIVLLEGDTIKGLVKYDLQQDLVQFSSNGNVVEAFTARKVLCFEIFDVTVHRYRKFYALPYATPAGYRSPVFFELLEEGKLTLLSREALEYRSYSSMYYVGSYSRLVLIYTFYFMNQNGDIEQFRGKKSDLLDLMKNRDEEVEKFMKQNRLRMEDKYDMKKIVAYYNEIAGS